MYKPAARSSCSFKTSRVARWLLHSIVPFHPLKCMGSPGEKMHLFQFLSTVHAKVAIFNPTNYIFLRSAINTLSTEHIKSSYFQSLKIRLECLSSAALNFPIWIPAREELSDKIDSIYSVATTTSSRHLGCFRRTAKATSGSKLRK